MIKIFFSILLSINIFALDTNTTKEIIDLEQDPLFHAKRESGLSLYDAISRAINISPAIQASYQKVVQSKESIKEEEAGHLPSINLSGDLGTEVRQMTGDRNAKKVDTTRSTSLSYKKIDLYLTVTENIWSGGSIEHAIDEKEASLQASLYDYRDRLEKLVVDTTTAYFNVVYGEIALKISLKNMKNYRTILNIVTIKEKNGAATKGDVNFIRANVDNAQTELVQKQKALSDALAKYTYLLQTETQLPYEITSDYYIEKDLNTSIQTAEENNAKILKQKAYIDATKFGFLTTAADFTPTINLAINAETRDEFDVGVGKREKVNALLTFSYNLYNGGKDEARAVRLLAKMNEQKYIYKDLKQSLVFDIKVLHRSVTSLADSLKLTQSEVLAARKVVKSYWLSFQNGTQDLQALQLAQRNLNRAEQDYATYKKNLLINNYNLMRKKGTLLKKLALSYKKHREDFTAEKIHLLYNYSDLK